jgi:hypothetical protein
VDFTACQTEEVRSGRPETRSGGVLTAPEGIRDARLWAGLTAIVRVISPRVVQGVASRQTRSFMGSTAATAEEHRRGVRGPWGIANSRHGVWDVGFRDDEQRHGAGTSAQNLAWLRKLAGCRLKAEKNSTGKRIVRRRLIAGWKNDDLVTVLAQIPEKSGA